MDEGSFLMELFTGKLKYVGLYEESSQCSRPRLKVNTGMCYVGLQSEWFISGLFTALFQLHQTVGENENDEMKTMWKEAIKA
jgi:hypothetical protein